MFGFCSGFVHLSKRIIFGCKEERKLSNHTTENDAKLNKRKREGSGKKSYRRQIVKIDTWVNK